MISLCESSEPLAEMCPPMGGTVRWVAALNSTLAHNVWGELHCECDRLCRRKGSVAQTFIIPDT